jgi:hypothetical protein
MRCLLVVALVAGCGGARPARSGGSPAREDERTANAVPAGPVQTKTREAHGAETTLSGYVFDPALDCVAAKLDGNPDPARYRHALPIECGTPLPVVDARLTRSADLATTVADMAKRFTEPVEIALGTAQHGDQIVVVIAARTVELEPFHTGDREIRGTLRLKVAKLRAVVSRSSGVSFEDVTRDGDAAFRMPAPEGDADVELVLVVGTETGPLAHVRVGKGSPLFATKGSLAERTAAARSAVGLPVLANSALAAAACKPVPAKVAGVEVNDHSTCYQIPLLDARYLGDEVAYTPLMQENLLHHDAAVLEVGTLGDQIGFRVLRKFEQRSDAEGRTEVLARLREKWPELVEKRTPQVREVLDAWAASGQQDETAEQFKAPLQQIAARWTTKPHYLVMLTTARELQGAIDRIQSDETPVAVELEYTQVRDKRGEMRHLIAIILAIP